MTAQNTQMHTHICSSGLFPIITVSNHTLPANARKFYKKSHKRSAFVLQKLSSYGSRVYGMEWRVQFQMTMRKQS